MAPAKKSLSKNRRKKIVELVLLESVGNKKTSRRRLNPVQQLRIVNEKRAANKRKYLPKLHKKNRKLYIAIRKNKSAIARKYNREIVTELKRRGYSRPQIVHAKKFSIVGKKVTLSVLKVATKVNKSATKFLVRGKWVSRKSYKASVDRAVKNARVRSYMELFGITKKQALKILKILKSKNISEQNELKSLIY